MSINTFIPFPTQAAERHFDAPYGESRERLLRMGIIDAEENVRLESVRHLAVPLIATLFENLLEAGEDTLGIYETLATMRCKEENTGMYLYLCVLYGQIGEVIPEPLQWLSSHLRALTWFNEVLVELLGGFLMEDGFLGEEEESESGNLIPFFTAPGVNPGTSEN